MLQSTLPVRFGQSFTPVQSAPAVQAQPLSQAPAADAVMFSGFHKDAVIGIDTKIAGTMSYPKETTRLYFKLKNSGGIEPHTYRTETPLVLIREAHNEHDPNAIAVYTEADRRSVRRKIGHVPAELAKELAPLMDRDHQFTATLLMIKPFKKEGEWFHSLEMRVEHITKPGKAPSARARKRIEQAFANAMEAQRFERVLGMLAEETHTLRVPGESGRLVERIDNDRNEATYYRRGNEVARVSLEDPQDVEFAEGPEVTDPVKEKVRKRLDKLA